VTPDQARSRGKLDDNLRCIPSIYCVGGGTVYRLTNTNCIQKGPLDSSFWILDRHNSCCLARAAATSVGRLRRLASTATDQQNMPEQYVRTPRVVRAVKSKVNRGDHRNRWKALHFSTVVNWSSRIYRMARVEQKKNKANAMTDNRVNLNSSCPVDHPQREPAVSLRFSAVTAKTPHGDRLDHFSGEVTL